MDVGDQRGALLGTQLTEARRRDHDERRRDVGEPAPEVDHERLERTAAELLGNRAAFGRFDSPQVLVQQKHVRVMGREAYLEEDVDKIVARAMTRVQPGDTITVFSNGGFGGIHGKLLEALKGLK